MGAGAWLAFVQAEQARVDFVGLLEAARRHHAGLQLVVLEESGFDPAGPPPELTRARLAVTNAAPPYSGRFTLTARPRDEEDLAAAREAEARGRASGMAALAERCRFVWEIAPDPDADEAALLQLAALCATVALGPVLPADRSTLLGVRSAMTRLAQRTGG
jgi:hypothetical protein